MCPLCPSTSASHNQESFANGRGIHRQWPCTCASNPDIAPPPCSARTSATSRSTRARTRCTSRCPASPPPWTQQLLQSLKSSTAGTPLAWEAPPALEVHPTRTYSAITKPSFVLVLLVTLHLKPFSIRPSLQSKMAEQEETRVHNSVSPTPSLSICRLNPHTVSVVSRYWSGCWRLRRCIRGTACLRRLPGAARVWWLPPAAGAVTNHNIIRDFDVAAAAVSRPRSFIHWYSVTNVRL